MSAQLNPGPANGSINSNLVFSMKERCKICNITLGKRADLLRSCFCACACGRQQSVLRCLHWSAPQSVRCRAASACQLAAYSCKTPGFDRHSTASWSNFCAIDNLSDMLPHSWFLAIHQTSLGLCCSSQTYIQTCLHVVIVE